MYSYIPFRKEHASQLTKLAKAYSDPIVYPGQEVWQDREVRIVAHGSRHGYIFHDSNVDRGRRLKLSPESLFVQMISDGINNRVNHVDLNCCNLVGTDFPMKFSKMVGKYVLVTAYPGSLKNPNSRGQEFTVQGSGRKAVVMDRATAMARYRGGVQVLEG